MQKIRKTFWYILGSFLAFIFNQAGVSAQKQLGGEVIALYGIEARPIPVPEAIASKILSPFVIGFLVVSAFIAGIIVFIRRKNKNTPKKS